MCAKVYKGNSYEFTLGNCVGKGGNGRVYEINILKPECKENCVVKILSLGKWGKGKEKERIKRYERFYKEIHEVLKLQNNVPGIMKILDFYCPDKMPEKKDVWYLMHKAQVFDKFSRSSYIDIKKKLKYMVQLSNILCDLHEKGYSHRDVKVANLLVLNGQLMLSDFGLIWNISDTRITREGDRVGPYYIGPPELENIDINMGDFRPSDVYLFAKVVWMILKNDNIGFKGEYKRDNKQFYLRSEEYEITTFEPIHKLLEKSTMFNMNERIDMKECRELIHEQLLVIDEIDSNKVLSYRFEEIDNRVINDEEPDERTYRDFNTIVNVLKGFNSIANVIITGSDEIISVDLVKQWKDQEAIVFKSNEEFGKTFLLYPDYIKRSDKKDGFELRIKKVERENIHEEFISYKESRRVMWENMNNNIFLDEPLIIRFEKKSYD